MQYIQLQGQAAPDVNLPVEGSYNLFIDGADGTIKLVNDQGDLTKYIVNNLSGQTISGDITISGGVTTSVVKPLSDNLHTLGTPELRWASVYVGEGTIYITDTVTGDLAGLTVTSGVLQIDGANQLQVGQLKFVDNNIESLTETIDIEIGVTGDTADLVLNRNTVLASGKSLTFSNGSIQTHSSDFLLTSYIDGNIGATVDLTKQVLVMSDGTWILPDGVEGQIMYFTLDNGGSAEDCYLTVNHLRYNNNGLGTQVINGSWSPFQYGSSQPDFAICTAIFTDGYWAFSGGRLRV